MNTFKPLFNPGLKISSIITAGGTSSRFGSNKLLENIELNGRKTSVILATIEKFLFCSGEIVIPCHNDVKEHIKNEMKTYVETGKIKFAEFGKTRQESVYNGLVECEKFNPDIVLIHDGARPYIEKETVIKAIEKLKTCKGVCVGVRAVDTIKILDENSSILKTIDRKTVFQAQTPQGFDFKTILDAHKKLKGENFTDDSSLLEHLGIEVFALEGSVTNKKITFKEDLN